MNALGWVFHLAVLWYALPILRVWWHGRGRYGEDRVRWLVVLSFGLPPIAALWLIPCAFVERRRAARYAAEAASAQAAAQRLAQHQADVAYWRGQATSGDPVAAANAAELLAMWRVPVIEPRVQRGLHGYIHWCECDRCFEARGVTPPWIRD